MAAVRSAGSGLTLGLLEQQTHGGRPNMGDRTLGPTATA